MKCYKTGSVVEGVWGQTVLVSDCGSFPLCVSFLVYKMKITIVPISWDYCNY